MTWLSALALGFLWSFVVSIHCAAMCGAFALMGGGVWRWQLGRLVGYGTLAAAIGGVGHGWVAAGLWAPLRVVPLGLSIVGVTVAAAALGQWWRLPAWRAPWIAPLQAVARRAGPWAPWWLGVGTALLPCGTSWGALSLAVGAGSAAAGFGIGVGLWLGSLPALLLTGWVGRKAFDSGLSPTVRRTLAVALWLGAMVAVGTRWEGLDGGEHCEVPVASGGGGWLRP